MCATMPPFSFTDLAMTFPPQQDDFYTQYYSDAPYRSATHPQYPPMEVQNTLHQAVWNETPAIDSFYASPLQTHTSIPTQTSSSPLQTQTTLPAQESSFWPTSLPESDHSYQQTAPTFVFSPAPAPAEFVFNQENSTNTRHSRGLSFTSVDSYASTNATSPDPSESNFSRSSSPGTADLSAFGYLNHRGTWSCAYPGCTSRAVFTRGCDLRKHHKRHTKSFFCRHPGCSQASGGGFSSKKDLARHEAKHNPGVACEWDGCDRIFSRVDNMVRSLFPLSSTSTNTCLSEGSLQTHTPKSHSSGICSIGHRACIQPHEHNFSSSLYILTLS